MLRRLENRLVRILFSGQYEMGIENVEWVALAAVMALMLMAAMAVLQPGGTQVGQTILDGILKWAKQIGGGG